VIKCLFKRTGAKHSGNLSHRALNGSARETLNKILFRRKVMIEKKVRDIIVVLYCVLYHVEYDAILGIHCGFIDFLRLKLQKFQTLTGSHPLTIDYRELSTYNT